MPKPKPSTVKLQVFKGREARLNKAIFHTLTLKSPLTICEISREIRSLRNLKHTKYTNVNRRIRTLEESGYLEKVGTRKTQAGFDATLYQLTLRPYIAILFNELDLDKLTREADEETMTSELAAIALFLNSRLTEKLS